MLLNSFKVGMVSSTFVHGRPDQIEDIMGYLIIQHEHLTIHSNIRNTLNQKYNLCIFEHELEL